MPQRIFFEVEGLPNDGELIWDDLDIEDASSQFPIVSYVFESVFGGDNSNTMDNRECGKLWNAYSPRLDKLEYKINVIGEVAIAIYATVFTSSIWLFIYVVGLKGFATTAIFLSPLAFIIIFATLRQILNKDRPGLK
jgi:hypothetical protein